MQASMDIKKLIRQLNIYRNSQIAPICMNSLLHAHP